MPEKKKKKGYGQVHAKESIRECDGLKQLRLGKVMKLANRFPDSVKFASPVSINTIKLKGE